MADEPHFPHFPYDPKALRRGAVIAAAIAAMAGGAALSSALDDGGAVHWARVGLCVGLLLAFAFAQWKLRRREGWGVTLAHDTLEVARPFSSKPLSVPYAEIASVRREGKKKEQLLVYSKEGGSLILSRRFFASEAAFEAVFAELSRRVPTRVLDA